MTEVGATNVGFGNITVFLTHGRFLGTPCSPPTSPSDGGVPTSAPSAPHSIRFSLVRQARRERLKLHGGLLGPRDGLLGLERIGDCHDGVRCVGGSGGGEGVRAERGSTAVGREAGRSWGRG